MLGFYATAIDTIADSFRPIEDAKGKSNIAHYKVDAHNPVFSDGKDCSMARNAFPGSLGGISWAANRAK